MVPKPPNEIEAMEGHLKGSQAQGKCWLDHAIKLMEKEKLDDEDNLLSPGRPIMHLYRTPLMTYSLLSHSSCHCSLPQDVVGH